jgi:hypothetical protein
MRGKQKIADSFQEMLEALRPYLPKRNFAAPTPGRDWNASAGPEYEG